MSWNAWYNEFQVNMTFLSTRHSVFANIQIPCSFARSSTFFLLLLNTNFYAIFLLKHKIGHNTIILFHQKKNNLQETKLEKVFIKTLCFSLKIMEMSRWGDSKWDWKSDSLDFEFFFWLPDIYYEWLGTKSQNLESIWHD